MHRKEVTHSNGSCERKSRGRKLANEMGRGKKKKIPLCSYRLTHRKRGTSELHDSYFRLMTITQAIPKIAEVKHPDRQISEEIAEAWRRVHITAWEFEGNIRPTNWTEAGQLSSSASWSGEVVEKATPGRRGSQEPWLNWGPEENEIDTTLPTITLGSVKIFQLCSVSSSPSHANIEQPFRTLAIKWEVNIFLKKSSCVFIIASVCIQYIYIYFCMN